MNACAVSGCDRPAHKRRLCDAHAKRQLRYGDATGGPPLRCRQGSLMKWLREHASRESDDCLMWPFGKLKGGYGSLLVKGKRTTAHRAMCELVHGAPPSADMDAAHSCGDRSCCNPRHIRWATRVENAGDRIAHGTAARGEKFYAATITNEQAQTIIGLLGTKSNREIAADLGVTESTVDSIAGGCSWSWLSGISRPKRRPDGVTVQVRAA